MFSNYKLGVQSGVDGVATCVDSNTDVYKSTADYIQKDIYGNVVGLCWPYGTQFTLELTSDTMVPVAFGSIILTVKGEIPNSIPQSNNTYAYNTADCKCWKYDSVRWVEQPDIVEFPNIENIVLFSKEGCTTTVYIKNFRNNVIFTATGDNAVQLHIDEKIQQGFYTVEIYRTCGDETVLVRKVSLSVIGSNGEESVSNSYSTTVTHQPININKYCSVSIQQATVGGLSSAVLEE